MFAIIKTGGKQIKVSQGDEIFVEKIESNEGEQIEFKEILMIDNKFGTPFLQDALVVGTILKQGKQKKIVVFHYKPKKTQHKKYGHRQPYTKVRIDEILLSAKDRKVEPKKIAKTDKEKTTKAVVENKKNVENKTSAIKETKVSSTKKTAVVSEKSQIKKTTTSKPKSTKTEKTKDK